MTTAIIYCGGNGERWPLPYPKQLHEVLGEPILHRTVRQLRERSVTNIMVLTRDDCLAVDGCENIRPVWPRRWLSEDIARTADLWRGQMLGLFGDVVWTDEAMDRLVGTEGFWFLGRDHYSIFTGGCPECFGWTWSDEHNARLLEACNVGVADAEEKSKDGLRYDYLCGAAWQPYWWLCGFGTDAYCRTSPDNWIDTDDLTDDVDDPVSGRRVAAAWKRHGGKTPDLDRCW